MTSLAAKLAPESIKKLIPYQSARRIGGEGRLWLNANELEHGIHYAAHTEDYNRYPDFLPHDIAVAYQNYCQTNVPAVAVRGADEAIDLLVRTFCKPGADKILISSPTYAMYEFCADAMAVETIDVPLKGKEFQLDVEGIIQKAPQAKIVFLCSPNNPTGNLLSRTDIVSVLEGTQHDALVVIDEAYIEFELAETVIDLIATYPNLVVIRTLSKAFGLAAVRCGFILTNEDIMEYVLKLIPPYPMPDCSAKIVLDALSPEGIDIALESTSEVIKTKHTFIEAIKNNQWIEHIYPSSTNFVLIRTNSKAQLFNYLKENGVVTRNQSHEPALNNCVRITIGSSESMIEVAQLINQYSISSL
ncbi:histidinol-phosphate transaminase [Vibrio neonatus]|uniref:histidinol-phosphate transaminase n=1 Tax=Vibrio neonatus TaxID=278860 RepID=UPI0021C3F46D|nr:histidinol-phosphate transaminase [Vibrio neonatus]